MAGTASKARSLLGQDFFDRAHERLTLEVPPGLADPNITPAHGDHYAQPLFELALNAAEVHDTFEVPLAFLMQPINHQRHSREWNGMVRHFYAIPFAERYIWGVTAGILRNLHDRIYR